MGLFVLIAIVLVCCFSFAVDCRRWGCWGLLVLRSAPLLGFVGFDCLAVLVGTGSSIVRVFGCCGVFMVGLL